MGLIRERQITQTRGQRWWAILFGALLLVALWLPATSAGPAVASATAANPDAPDLAQSPPVTTPPRTVTLQASATDVPPGRSVALTARTTRPATEDFLITIRREGPHMGWGLEKACRAQPICTVDVRADQASALTYAVSLYRCDSQDICFLEEDSTDADKVRVTWR